MEVVVLNGGVGGDGLGWCVGSASMTRLGLMDASVIGCAWGPRWLGVCVQCKHMVACFNNKVWRGKYMGVRSMEIQ